MKSWCKSPNLTLALAAALATLGAVVIAYLAQFNDDGTMK